MFGIGPQYYSHIYIWLVTILSLVIFSRYSYYPQGRLDIARTGRQFGVDILSLFLVFFIGLRPVSAQYFLDMAVYSMSYETYFGEPFIFDWNATNKLYDNLFLFFASNRIPSSYFFLTLAAIYFIGIAWSTSSLFPRDSMAAFLVCLGAFSTFSYGTNGIKAGAAASLFLVALALFQKRKMIGAVLFFLLSLGFHHSMILPVAAFIVCLFVKNPKWYFAFWILCLVIAAFHITYFQHLFASFSNESGSRYLSGGGETIRTDIFGGFRMDFILYSVAPIVIGWIAVFNKRVVSKHYPLLLNIYTLVNAIWLLCMYAEFTNRIAYLSWFMYPIVLIYPLLNERFGIKQYSIFEIVAFLHLLFTLVLRYLY